MTELKPVREIPTAIADYLLLDAEQNVNLRRKFDDIHNELVTQPQTEIANDLLDTLDLDIRKIYCCKTGRCIGERDMAEVNLMLKLYETDKTKTILEYYSLTAGPSMLWTQTDPESLDKLQQADPQGYFVYCAGLVCKRFKQNTPQGRTAFQNNLIQGYENLKSVELNKIIAANEIWRRLLSLFDVNKMKPFDTNQTVIRFCSDKGIAYLIDEMSKKIEEVYENAAIDLDAPENLLNDYVVIAALGNVPGGGEGNPAFRGQKLRNVSDLGAQLDILFRTTMKKGLNTHGEIKFNRWQDGSIEFNAAKPAGWQTLKSGSLRLNLGNKGTK